MILCQSFSSGDVCDVEKRGFTLILAMYKTLGPEVHELHTS